MSAPIKAKKSGSTQFLQRVRAGLRRLPGVLLIALGTFLLGLGLGSLVMPMVSTEPAAAPVLIPAVDEAQRSTVMPDVAGLTIEQAARVLADQGLGEVSIESSTTAYVGPEGLVVEQQPPAGADVSAAPEQITVTVSQAGTIPDVAGMTVQEARAELEKFGVVAAQSEVYSPAESAGRVISSEPEAGKTLTEDVTLAVASAGDTVYLTTLATLEVDGCFVDDEVQVEGAGVRTALQCRADRGEASVEYVLGRHAAVLEFIAGVNDRSETGTAMLRVLGDGQELATIPMALGSSTPQELDVSGVLRLRIEVADTTSEDEGATPSVVLVDPRLTGDPRAIQLLVDQAGG
ncbi:MAG: PASTA domain-containing protein [Actinomycetia bacterium]|nr:PASTA domain-containing protein [Actinomycetes bacterium]